MIHYEVEFWANHKWQLVRGSNGKPMRCAEPKEAFEDKDVLEGHGDKARVVQVLEKRKVIDRLSMVQTK